MSAVGTRWPLVYANTRVLEGWTGERALENVVADAIAAGRITWRRARGIAIVELPGGSVAVVRRTRGRLDPTRKAWLVTEVVASAAAAANEKEE